MCFLFLLEEVKFTFAGADRDLALGCGGGGGVEMESCGEVPTKWKFSMLWCLVHDGALVVAGNYMDALAGIVQN
jgi:hypothetical protein